MGSHRVRLAKDKGELVKRLVESNDSTAPFSTYADVVMFAATLGYQGDRQLPLGDRIASEPAPIAWEVFSSRGYARAIELLAIANTEDVTILSGNDDDAIVRQVSILEEYANGGLEYLQQELRGAIDITSHLLLMLDKHRRSPQPLSSEEFDLTRFL